MDEFYKNIYMFKNPIRHFLNVENLIYNEIKSNKENTWTQPIIFKIRKYYGSSEFRTLSLPNFQSFYSLYERIKSHPNFYDLKSINPDFSKISVNLTTGDFSVFNYENHLNKDLERLTRYDTLFKMDIKSFYNSIYTHKLTKFITINNDPNEQLLSSLNFGVTKGILMGNYVSLFCAELFLKKIMGELYERLRQEGILFELNYFSDDVYIFSFDKNEQIIKNSFNDILFKNGLESNENKLEKYNYEKYNSENILIKYWKQIVSKQKEYESRYKEDINKYYLNFLNQIIYRRDKLNNKNKAVLTINFFKSNFFINMDTKKYQFTGASGHQIQFLIKEHPEILLYFVTRFEDELKYNEEFKKFLKFNFENSLDGNFFEEQLYYFYAIVILYSNCIIELNNLTEKVLKCDNQILKSYWLEYFSDYDLEELLINDECNWFFNYHLIRKLKIQKGEKFIERYIEYLLPVSIKGESQTNNYLNFYKNNLSEDNTFVRFIDDVKIEIKSYLDAKLEERELNEDYCDIDEI